MPVYGIYLARKPKDHERPVMPADPVQHLMPARRTALARSARQAAPSAVADVAQELVLRIRPNGGETVCIRSRDFDTVADALTAIGHALDEGDGLILREATTVSEEEQGVGGGVVINLANVAWVQVAPTGTHGETGQYI